jgi:hypothetical protein
MEFYVYVIFAEPDVYIGYTRNIKRRMAEHGNPPFWAILETVDGSVVRDAEVKWIQQFTELGVGLLNRNREFSNGCLHLSEEARKSVSKFHKGRKKPASFGARIKELWQDPAYRALMAARPRTNAGSFKKGELPKFTPYVEGHTFGRATQFKKGQPNPGSIAKQMQARAA